MSNKALAIFCFCAVAVAIAVAQVPGIFTTLTADSLSCGTGGCALTNVPTAPTAAAGTNTTQIATTAFVHGTFTGTSGYQKEPNGLITEWVQGATQSTSGSTQTVTLPLTCPTAILSVMVGTVNENGGSPTDTDMAFYQEVSATTSSVTVFMMRNADHAFDPAAPTIWVKCY